MMCVKDHVIRSNSACLEKLRAEKDALYGRVAEMNEELQKMVAKNTADKSHQAGETITVEEFSADAKQKMLLSLLFAR